MSLMDKMGAIWKALDDMAEKDPEKYKTFIQEQLDEGRKIFGNSQNQKSEEILSQTFSNMNISTGTSNSKTTQQKLEQGKAKNPESGPKRSMNEIESKNSELLDDCVGTSSLLTSIVQVLPVDEKEEDDNFQLLLPTNSVHKKKTPMIEEL